MEPAELLELRDDLEGEGVRFQAWLEAVAQPPGSHHNL